MGSTMMKFFFKLILAVVFIVAGAGAQADMQEMHHDHKNHKKEVQPASCDDAGPRAEAALKEVRPLAANGDAHAQFELGFMYDRGNGVHQDFKEAASWYRKAAEQGNAPAQFYLGQMYDLGKGVIQDYKEAAVWYLKAAEQGETMAQLNLGFLYGQGQGVSADMVQAHKWYGLAATAGNEIAQKSKKDAETKMTPKEIEEAQALAQEWLARHK